MSAADYQSVVYAPTSKWGMIGASGAINGVVGDVSGPVSRATISAMLLLLGLSGRDFRDFRLLGDPDVAGVSISSGRFREKAMSRILPTWGDFSRGGAGGGPAVDADAW